MLPSETTIRRLLSGCMEKTGPCSILLNAVKARLDAKNSLEKYATLGFDAMSLNEALRYHEHIDQIVGFEDVGEVGRTEKIANQGLIAVLRGIHGNWKLPIAYYLIRDNTSQGYFEAVVKECITVAYSAGVSVKVLTCDQEKTQWAWLVSCGVEPDKTFIHHPVTNEPVFVIPDPPHCLKNARNALMKHDILFAANKFARWEDIERL